MKFATTKFRQKSKQEQAAASKLRMEKRGEKLEAAKEKLAKQKPPKKPGPVKRVGRVASGSVYGFVHGKIYENEHENVGIEGGHRSELVGEAVLRHGSRYVKRKVREHPAKAVRRAESKYIRPRRTITSTPPPRSIRSFLKMPCPVTGRNGGSASGIKSRQRRPPNKERGPLKKLPLPQKSWRPGRWALSNAIPWAVCWPWPASCLCW